MAKTSTNFIAWLQVFRLPNLFTVPGDAMAGFFLASAGVASPGIILAGLSVLALYMAGLAFNDYFDRNVDAAERPRRPLPSGAVQPEPVLRAGLALLGGGVLLAFFGSFAAGLAALVLAGLVFFYNAGVKKHSLAGPVFLGACRAGSVLTGALMAGSPLPVPIYLAMAMAFFYVLALSLAARDEAQLNGPGDKVLLVPWAWVLACLALLFLAPGRSPLMWCISLAAVGAGLWEILAALRLVLQGKIPAPAFVGSSIRVLLWAQLLWFATAPGPVSDQAIFYLFTAFLLARFLAGHAGRRFYGS